MVGTLPTLAVGSAAFSKARLVLSLLAKSWFRSLWISGTRCLSVLSLCLQRAVTPMEEELISELMSDVPENFHSALANEAHSGLAENPGITQAGA